MLELAAALLFCAVVDGDTAVCPGIGKVRVENIDAPESGWRAKCDYERALSARASKRAAELLAAGIRLEHEGKRDPYDRLLARVVLPDGRDLGQVLIDERLARRWAGRRENWCDAG